MTTAKKTPVRIVCPHCRRSYVVQVDLKRINQTAPRAVCSRCGGRFEVLQRMFIVDQKGSPTTADKGTALGRVGTKPRRGRRKPGKRRSTPLPRPRSGARKARRGLGRPESDSTLRQTASEIPSAKGISTVPPPPGVGESEGEDEKVTPVRRDLQGDARRGKQQGRRRKKQSEELDSTVPPPEPSGFWADSTPTQPPEEMRPAVAADLDAPMPWVEKARGGLEAIDSQLPESVASLEWLLTQPPERPHGASPVPVPVDQQQPSSTPPPEQTGADRKGE